MVTIDVFDQFDQYSNYELKNKLHQLKFNNINTFIEDSINKTYILYKKNKKSDISFLDYRKLMLKELGKPKTKKRNRPDSHSPIESTCSKIDLSSLISEDEESNCV